jgi:predicted metal-dependent phosphoesterase TrpH
MVKNIFADLHNHTTASDGDFTPEQMVKQAKTLGTKVIGITDHDTLEGLKIAVLAGGKYGIEVIPGVEVSIRFKRPDFTGTLHLLCYFSAQKLSDVKFTGALNEILAKGRGEKLVRARILEINKVFGPDGENPILKRKLEFEDISKLSKNATRRHFALALNESFNITNKDTINLIIGNDSPAYLPSGIDLDQAKDILAQKGILAVLAHPAAGSFSGEGHYKEVLPPVEVVEKIMPEFVEAGIKGLEVYYPGHSQSLQELMISWAKKYDLLVTGGSDCHDAIERPTGVTGISEEQFLIFKNAL